jgi:hypothetical protein
MPMRRTLLLISLTTSGCAGTSVTGIGLENAAPPAPAAAPARPPAPDGKKLADLVNAAFATAKLTGAAEVSAVRPTHDSQWGDWVFCIKGTAPSSPKYAVLVGHDAILEVRTSVVIDGCGQETYRPLAPAVQQGKAAPHK